MQSATVKVQSGTEGDPSDGESPSYCFSSSSSRTGSDSSMDSNISIHSHEQQQQENTTSISKMNSSSSTSCKNNTAVGDCDESLSLNIRDRLSLAPSYQRSFSSYSSSVDIGLGIDMCSMEERMERDNDADADADAGSTNYSNGSSPLNHKTHIPHPLKKKAHSTDNTHTHASPGNRSKFQRPYRRSSSTSKGSSMNSLQGVSASLRSVRFTSFPCRPQLSMQRNAVFNVVTTQSQEFNKVRSARNVFFSENSKSLSSHMNMGSLDIVDEMNSESHNMSVSVSVSVQLHALQRRSSAPDFMVDGMREIQMFKKRQKLS